MSGADEKALLQTLRIRQATACDHAALADLWRRSVEATHYFLSSGEVERLFHDVRNTYLPGVEILWVAELAPCGQTAPAQHAAGFIGCNGAQVEMLFVEPRCFRHGVGRALLEHVRALHPRLTLDVNEQNPQALAFYERQGFKVVGRSALDGQGNPYPLLHMEWQGETA
ncbi:putative N-acetyltransferase YjaB [anaerobic digester metagenome]|uniref:GNAT family N-acetyltransferase n=1 Tax=Desulfovibrio desulfuricans TaxID=876 RepID=UPI001F2632FE|nr:GNAT family N-acetyltransferase [Desulfovibrio desulfuricans]UIB00322.1 GNAT family N-acetyltransferase [Desulfovibrio desulfuricans]